MKVARLSRQRTKSTNKPHMTAPVTRVEPTTPFFVHGAMLYTSMGCAAVMSSAYCTIESSRHITGNGITRRVSSLPRSAIRNLNTSCHKSRLQQIICEIKSRTDGEDSGSQHVQTKIWRRLIRSIRQHAIYGLPQDAADARLMRARTPLLASADAQDPYSNLPVISAAYHAWRED